MTITSERLNQSAVVMFLNGRLDTASAPMLERKIKQLGDGIAELVLDLSGLNYISSMGLRVLLQTHKTVNAQGRQFAIKNMNDSIREVFEMTGFVNLLVHDEKFVVIRKDEGKAITFSLNGQMDSSNVPTISKELALVSQTNRANGEAAVVHLDIAKLASISAGACKLLKKTIAETAWDNRAIDILNAPKDLRQIFETEGMGHLLK